MASHFGPCSICGQTKKLSFEHIPPKKAFNNLPVMTSHWQDLLNARSQGEFSKVRRSTQRKEFGNYTICEKCNNDTGAWYGPSYIEWANQGALNLAYVESGEAPLAFEIRPLFVFKMLVTMFASACGPNMLEKNRSLRRFVLDRECRNFPTDISIYGSFTSYDSTLLRQSGVSGLLNLEHDQHSVFSEITTYPFSYLLNFKGSRVPDERLVCLDSFLNFAPDERKSLRIPFAALPVNSMFPADFRSSADIWNQS